MYEEFENSLYDCEFFRRAPDVADLLVGPRLPLSILKDGSCAPVRVHHLPPKAVHGAAARGAPSSRLRPAPGANLGRQFPTVLSSHDPFELLEDRAEAVVCEELRAIDYGEPCLPAQELVMRGLISVLKPAPPTDVEDEDGRKRSPS
ncbi:hypothetical protein D3C80_1530190 [compost metagenome]